MAPRTFPAFLGSTTSKPTITATPYFRYVSGILIEKFDTHQLYGLLSQALSNVRPVRDYFLKEANYAGELAKRPPGDIMVLLVQRFGELIRKMWNSRKFKAHVSPHEMLQAVVLCSKKKFQFTKQGAYRNFSVRCPPLVCSVHVGIILFSFWLGDAVDFISWFLNAMHKSLNGDEIPTPSYTKPSAAK